MNLEEIKKYILEDGKEYRRNILVYLQWVMGDYEKRKEAHNQIVQDEFKSYPFYTEGIKTRSEWNRINKRGSNDFLIEHKSSKNGWIISLKLSKEETEGFLKSFADHDIPKEISKWEYKMPSENDFIKATKSYNENDWIKSKRKVIIQNKEYQLKALSSIAIGIANDLDSPANFYMFTTQQLKNHIEKNCPNFKIMQEKNDLIKENDSEDEYNGDDDMPNDTIQTQPLNQILYGPPGTGKTYHTINKALEIIDGIVPETREEAKEKFEEYRKSGQIEFITFHQSYGYEEFVEGIKAIPPKEKGNENGIEMIYKVVNGIFKNLCEKAIKEEVCFEKNNIDLKKYLQIGDKLQAPRSEFQITSIDNDSIKVLISNGQEHQASINTIKEYLRLKDFSSRATGSNLTYEPTIAKHIFEKINIHQPQDNTEKNYILIIDEINRGNISKIFGELITLIEESKRIGKDEAISVKLPYSGDLFGVPSNLYIIGTMNTADRSIALMDTALRRRFDFKEMMPRPDLLSKITISSDNQEINIKSLLETINKRIEYLYDRDHTIGHAYFMSLKDEKITDKKAELDNIFRNKIIPLLQEYFYDDWEKIQIVLGDHYAQIKKQENYNGEDCKSFDDSDNTIRFIQSQKITEKSVIGFNHENIEDEGKDYRINPNENGFPKEAYLKLCQSK